MKDKRKIIAAIVVIILSIAGAIWGISYTDEDVNKIVNGVETVANIIEDNISTTEIPELKQEDEQVLEVQETDLENEAFEAQGNIAYNGSDKTPVVQVGEYKGLTYYSQADSRWANHMYSAIKDKSQTIEQSGCGPTAAAMVVSSIKGAITPDKMGDLFVKYGYRSTNNGTYFSAMKWVADAFNIGYKETYSLDTAVNLLKQNYYIIVSCNEGLFTYGGHFIVLVGVDNNNLRVFDSYLYNGKFTTSSRKKANVKVEGNNVYVSVSNFKKYANATKFYCYKNDRTDTKDNDNTVTTKPNTSSNVKVVNYQAKVTAKIGLNARTGAGTNYSIKTAYTYNTTLKIVAESNGWGKTDKGYWVCLTYTKKVTSTTSTTKTMTVIAKLGLNARSGPGTSYYIKTAYPYKTKLTIISTSGNWGKTNKGYYVCLTYLK